jgi:hypothetical protein
LEGEFSGEEEKEASSIGKECSYLGRGLPVCMKLPRMSLGRILSFGQQLSEAKCCKRDRPVVVDTEVVNEQDNRKTTNGLYLQCTERLDIFPSEFEYLELASQWVSKSDVLRQPQVVFWPI